MTHGYTRDPSLDVLGIPVLFVVARGIARTVDPALGRAACATWVADLLARHSYESVAAEPALAGYRALHARLGKTGRQYLPSPESLFKLLFKRGAWRSIDPLVDAYSLVSLRTRVSIGAHDLARLTPPVRLAATRGGESFVPIGETAPLLLGAGEYAYRDATGRILGRMEIRQAADTCVTATTRDLLFIVQGHASLPGPVLADTAHVLIDTLRALVGPIDEVSFNAVD